MILLEVLINTCLILSTIYILIPLSGCVDLGTSALLCPGEYDVVKTALGIVLLKFTKNN